MDNSKLKAYGAGVAISFVFGATYIAMKMALRSIEPMMIIFFRYLIAFGVLHFIYFKFSKREKIQKEDYKALFILGMLEPVLFFIFDAYGLKFTTAIRASILLSTIPVMTAILAWPVLKEKLTPIKIITTFGSVFGVYLVVSSREPLSAGDRYLLGDLLIFGACVIAAFYTVLARKMSFKYSFFTITRVQSIIAAVAFFPLMIGEALYTGLPSPRPESILAVLYMGVFASALGYSLLNYTIAKLSAANSSIFANLIPAVTMFLSVMILDEYAGLQKIIGLIIISVFVFSLSYYERHQ